MGVTRRAARPAAPDPAHRPDRAQSIAGETPDCLITIDSPDFTLRVARKVRAANPSIPIVHYVCPSVWAWRPGRAPAMRPYVDHMLCLLPFEPDELERLGGPPGTYVGHRLTHDPGILLRAAAQAAPRDLPDEREKTLLLLPGSRRSEVKRLLAPFGETVSILHGSAAIACGLLLPTVPHVADIVAEACRQLAERSRRSSSGPRQKWQAFGEADAALIASGTVSLELALAGVPMVSCYKIDPLVRPLQRSDHDLVGVAAQPHRRPADRAGILRRIRAARRCSRA